MAMLGQATLQAYGLGIDGRDLRYTVQPLEVQLGERVFEDHDA